MKKRYSYDAWGRPRNPSTWLNLSVNANDATGSLNAMQPMFDRGYTGHEHMACFGLINMNGRLYDPYVQRFLSPDPFIQAPGNAQNYNRYSYVLNNPLMYTDPSGYSYLESMKKSMGESGGGGFYYRGEYLAYNSFTKNFYSTSSGQNFGSYSGVGGGGDGYWVQINFWTPLGSGGFELGEFYSINRWVPIWNGGNANSAPQGGGDNWATATLAFIALDASIPEPTDAVWPKWAAYGVAATAATVYLHANSKNSPKPNIVYEIFSINLVGDTQTMKYGVSSRTDFVTRSGNPRPEYQCVALNAVAPPGVYYWYTVLARTPDRASALSIERSLVNSYISVHGRRPLLQTRP